MPRKNAKISTRQIEPDPVYSSRLVSKFISHMMLDGKRSTAQGIFYRALETVGERGDDEALKLFKKAVDNVRPAVEVKSRRVGGSTYQVPIEVRPSRRLALSMRWLIQSAKKRGEKTMNLRLANEFMDAAQTRGTAIKKREDTHRMAEANKAFAHYRW